MKLFCDLHIHSCLSPCGDALMTPNNIVGMAYIKQLDAIAVCDHNTAENLPAMQEVADMMGISQSYISRLEKRILTRLHGELAEITC